MEKKNMENGYNSGDSLLCVNTHLLPEKAVVSNGLIPASPVNLGFVAHTWVYIETFHGCKVEGQVMDNRNSRMSDCITLCNVLNSGKSVPGHHNFFKNQIKSVSPIANQEWPHDPNSCTFSPNEKVMDTFIITSKKDLEMFIASLADVTEIGCYLEIEKGRFESGRFGRCDCILMNVKNVLIVVVTDSFESYPEQLWMTLGKNIFSNEGMLKVFFNSMDAYDYLYHKHSILLQNAYDLKIIYSQLIEKTKNQKSSHNCAIGLQPLEPQRKRKRNEQCELWELFLSNAVPLMEYGIMDDCSNQLLGQSIQRKKLALKVKYLLLLKDEMQKAILQPAKFLMESGSNHMQPINTKLPDSL